MLYISLIIAFCVPQLNAQPGHPVNGVKESYKEHYILYNAFIHVSAEKQIYNGYIEIEGDRILSCGAGKKSAKGAIEVDLKGKHVYPSFIDLHANVGLDPLKPSAKKSYGPQMESNKKGAFYWNEAIKPEQNASDFLSDKDKSISDYQKGGFGVALSHVMDGIMRGTGTVIATAELPDNQRVLKGTASQHFSFSKGSSKQDYPSSLMGMIALLRQVYFDLDWYKDGGYREARNLSLEAIENSKELPAFFDAGNYLNQLRALKLSKSIQQDFIVRGYGEEYKRIGEFVKHEAKLILPLHFPLPIDPVDPYETMLVSLEELKEWELAPANAAKVHEAGLEFAFTSHGLKSRAQVFKALRKVHKYGLPKEAAIAALTEKAASFIDMSDELGTLEAGKYANFIILSKDLFEDDAVLHENWVLGNKIDIDKEAEFDIRGKYDLKIGDSLIVLEVAGSEKKLKSFIKVDTTKISVEVKQERKLISLAFKPTDSAAVSMVRLSGQIYFDSGIWEGNGVDGNGEWLYWTAIRSDKHKDKKKETKTDSLRLGRAWFPNMAFGLDSLPESVNILIKNATVWTNEEEGILEETSVLVSDGKIKAIGKDILDVRDGIVIDAKGKHLTTGIIDEHSHIAASGGVNEGGQAVAAEVTLEDVINPDDVNIYRQLAGGVTCSQILHGSADPIGGRSALIKLKWGAPAEEMMVENAPKFIKFALGENVKQSNWGDFNTVRFPQTRMGVEQVYYDAFYEARKYAEKWDAYNKSMANKRKAGSIPKPRRDEELEVLNEILNGERFITCHSYVQSEINMLMHVADSMGFTLNTFTHILEGYKLADKMKAHGAGASTFSDWWAYKYEVKDAIPYNAAILDKMGIVTAINSDDAEMARRLNQEAAKAVKYGQVSEEDAWKMVTLNPAKLLHIDDRMGSIKVGKDADLVLWSDNPLSIYATVEKTIIEGVVYYDAELTDSLRTRNTLERERILELMMEAKKAGEPVRSPKKETKSMYNCKTATLND